jgi:SAM-dependent methyltransferase
MYILERLVERELNRNHSHGFGRAARNLQKEIKIYANNKKGLKLWGSSRAKYNTEFVQVGGGEHYLEGYLNIDILPPADLICDVREGIPIKDKCVKYIFSEHFLEHLDDPDSAKSFILECFRILDKDGELVIGVPDSKLVTQNYLRKNVDFYNEMIKKWYKNRDCIPHINTYIDLVNYNLRDQDDDFKYNPHYWGYDFEKLKSLLVSAGFVNVKKWEFDDKIANPKREWGSVYVCAKK